MVEMAPQLVWQIDDQFVSSGITSHQFSLFLNFIKIEIMLVGAAIGLVVGVIMVIIQNQKKKKAQQDASDLIDNDGEA
jgi:hypothetical protein